ncbi:NADPH:quinone reductase-like Zn-dependent oxidoreductase [Sinobaca qinghaiensis]|uniref:NADPH:quinone reductase-like Zn-dependent oxidoreductase n=1 Tax=Sinobaca qinghaiensis TaxID=342944 RepID=A0A419V073_9BACL|nr:NADP-dependent oxidoreductase [Sinobaca qinghaiensis]RKD71366.1 NADPH:quinone reductase-like Zn-dependent oxidoreductase [Sinobaca qinghaiensis]
MKAVVLDRFGGPEELALKEVPIPVVGDDEVLIKVMYAGIGQWDIFEREGGYDSMLGLYSDFPYILGSEGSGVVYAKGKNVDGLAEGDRVYAPGFLNPKGGFYAEYAAVAANDVKRIPDSLTSKEAGVISGIGITSLRGLEDVLKLQKEETIMILGAGGGVGHLAVQIARQMGARVFAIASGTDGVSLLQTLQVEAAVDGRKDDVIAAAEDFVYGGFDKALFTAGGDFADSLIQCIGSGGQIAYPNGVQPISNVRSDIRVSSYNGDPEPDIINRLYNRIRSGKIRAHIDQEFALSDFYNAHLALADHYVGKLCFKINN